MERRLKGDRPLALQISDIKGMLATGNYTGPRKLALEDELDELEDRLNGFDAGPPWD